MSEFNNIPENILLDIKNIQTLINNNGGIITPTEKKNENLIWLFIIIKPFMF